MTILVSYAHVKLIELKFKYMIEQLWFYLKRRKFRDEDEEWEGNVLMMMMMVAGRNLFTVFSLSISTYPGPGSSTAACVWTIVTCCDQTLSPPPPSPPPSPPLSPPPSPWSKLRITQLTSITQMVLNILFRTNLNFSTHTHTTSWCSVLSELCISVSAHSVLLSPLSLGLCFICSCWEIRAVETTFIRHKYFYPYVVILTSLEATAYISRPTV